MFKNNPTLFLLLGISQSLIVASLGCRSTTDNQIDLLERELRVQEDYIYELEDYVVEYSEKIRDLRCEYPQQTAVYSEEIRSEAAPVFVPQKAPQKNRKPTSQRQNDETSPEEDLPSMPERSEVPEISPEDLEVPDIELDLEEPVGAIEDTQSLQQVVAMDYEEEEFQEGQIHIPDPVDFEQDALASERKLEAVSDEQFIEDLFADEQVEETAAIVERVVDRLEVAQIFQSEGDELSPQNLLTVVEALDAKGEPVDMEGEVSLMVMTADGAAPKRLKRWDFTAAETVAAWQSSNLGDGLHLELPLEKTNLSAGPLELWVRLVTADGRKLLTQLPFEPNQLKDIADLTSRPLPSSGLALVETEAGAKIAANASSSSPAELEPETAHQPAQLTEIEKPASAEQPRWRASMQRTDRPAEGFATSSSKAQGWTTQSLAHRQAAATRVARRSMPIPAAPTPTTTKPIWTAGRSVLPSAPAATQIPSGASPASWSTSR